ncbi:hypothetical protein HK098_003167 [Nowakowskiella sp. JEL0407]|nr:hypothetical protein HK098_003167 [Nowakowskiella sp. JEL0407]
MKVRVRGLAVPSPPEQPLKNRDLYLSLVPAIGQINLEIVAEKTDLLQKTRKEILDALDSTDALKDWPTAYTYVLMYQGKKLLPEDDQSQLHELRIRDGFVIQMMFRAIPAENPVVETLAANDAQSSSVSSDTSCSVPASAIIPPSIASGSGSSSSSSAPPAVADPNFDPYIHMADDDFCKKCRKDRDRECKLCGCFKCGFKMEPGKTIVLCKQCGSYFHLDCDEKAKSVEGDWYCSECSNNDVVHSTTKKESKNKKKENWDKGQACVGREKECTIVPKNHVGAIPGVPVGIVFQYRNQVSQYGLHGPLVQGISGTPFARSVVLSGGYPEDKDFGEEFTYTGAGGRDLSGNKRVNKQTMDQTLTGVNLTLANCCDCKLSEDGGEAVDWKNGQPIRVIRGSKDKHSSYAPKEGYRYDGLYKVVKVSSSCVCRIDLTYAKQYWTDKGDSGFKVWRYLLRRDDPTPAPWTDEGKALIKSLGLDRMAYKSDKIPADYADFASYKIPDRIKELIAKDKINAAKWEEFMEANEVTTNTVPGIVRFYDILEDHLACVICSNLPVGPTQTPPCGHNMCYTCCSKHIQNELQTVESIKDARCPGCRQLLVPATKNDDDENEDEPKKITKNEIHKRLFNRAFDAILHALEVTGHDLQYFPTFVGGGGKQVKVLTAPTSSRKKSLKLANTSSTGSAGTGEDEEKKAKEVQEKSEQKAAAAEAAAAKKLERQKKKEEKERLAAEAKKKKEEELAAKPKRRSSRTSSRTVEMDELDDDEIFEEEKPKRRAKRSKPVSDVMIEDGDDVEAVKPRMAKRTKRSAEVEKEEEKDEKENDMEVEEDIEEQVFSTKRKGKEKVIVSDDESEFEDS